MTDSTDSTNIIQMPTSNEVPTDIADLDVNSLPDRSDNFMNAEEAPQDENSLSDEDKLRVTLKQASTMLKYTGDLIRELDSVWAQVSKDFRLNADTMEKVLVANTELRTPPPTKPEDPTRGKPIEWDPLNGINKMDAEKVVELFGKKSPIISPDHKATLERVYDVSKTFYDKIMNYRRFNHLELECSDLSRDLNRFEIAKLRKVMEDEEDPSKKSMMQESLDKYANYMYLNFLGEQLDPRVYEYMVNAYRNPQKIQYIVERTKSILERKTVNIPPKFMLEISSFEKRFLPEKYHKQDNILLLYFMNNMVYNQFNGKNKASRELCAMALVLDGFIRNRLPEDEKALILDNIMVLEDQFLGAFPDID